jgi:hypothetical protein
MTVYTASAWTSALSSSELGILLSQDLIETHAQGLKAERFGHGRSELGGLEPEGIAAAANKACSDGASGRRGSTSSPKRPSASGSNEPSRSPARKG